jgi:hypothetical protein
MNIDISENDKYIIENNLLKRSKTNNYFILNRDKWNAYLKKRYHNLSTEQKKILNDKSKQYFKDNKKNGTSMSKIDTMHYQLIRKKKL